MKKILVIAGIASLFITILAASVRMAPVSGFIVTALAQSDEKPTSEDDEETEEECPDDECDDEEACEQDTWRCNVWSQCSTSGKQERKCQIIDDCPDVSTPKPAETQTCTVTPPETTTPPPPEQTETATPSKQPAPDTTPSAQQPTPETQPAKNPQPQTPPESRKLDTAAEAARLEVQRQEQEARRAAEEKRLEEARKQAEEEARAIQEEQLQKQAQLEAQKKAEEELVAKLREAQKNEQTFKTEVAASSAFENLLTAAAAPAAPLVTDTNNNGVPDHLETAPSKVDEELVKFQADLAVQENRLVTEQRVTPQQARELVAKVLEKKKVEKKVQAIRETGKKKYGIQIRDSRQGIERGGTSDEVAILLGFDPSETAGTKEALLPLEKKLLRIKDTAAIAKKCSMSIANGDRLPAKGFTILAACPGNRTMRLTAIDSQGKEIIIGTKPISDNGKIVYAVDTKFVEGNFVFQLKEEKTHPLGLLPRAWFVSALGSDAADTADVQSDPVLVNIVEDTDVPQPVVQSIEGVEIAGLSDIKVSAAPDGKIRVTGLSDISTMVVGTFSSAVFTSAILADVENGSFEVVSPQPLGQGDHEVVIYATKPEESLQSPPVKLRFSIIETAQAASENAPIYGAAPLEKGSAQSRKFPVVPVAGLALLGALLIGIGLHRRGKNGKAAS